LLELQKEEKRKKNREQDREWIRRDYEEKWKEEE